MLEELKAESNNASKWKVAGFAGLFLSTACFSINETAAAIVFVIGAIFSFFKFLNKMQVFVYNYKEVIIKEIIDYLNPGAIYEPLQMISQKDYEFSGLYPRRYDVYSGEDFIRGIYKTVTYHCSELQTCLTGLGRHGNEIRIFKGLFFAAPISYQNGATYVWPNNDIQLPVSIADYHFERFLPLPAIAPVDMNNSDFERYYTVYSTDSSFCQNNPDQ